MPWKRPEPTGRYRSLEERLQIADLYLGGAGVRAIAVRIGRGCFAAPVEVRPARSSGGSSRVGCPFRGLPATPERRRSSPERPRTLHGRP